jgi:hypothetical protein
MTNDPLTHAHDRQCVNVYDNDETDFWTALGINKERLEQLAKAEDDRADGVRRALTTT